MIEIEGIAGSARFVPNSRQRHPRAPLLFKVSIWIRKLILLCPSPSPNFSPNIGIRHAVLVILKRSNFKIMERVMIESHSGLPDVPLTPLDCRRGFRATWQRGIMFSIQALQGSMWQI
jgi:hypothetical protein